VLLSTGSGFGTNTQWSGAGFRGKPVHVGDFNGDGGDDLMRYFNECGGAEMLLSTGSDFQYADYPEIEHYKYTGAACQ
jgi:hypothetical protein